jgi:hypothetical protein
MVIWDPYQPLVYLWRGICRVKALDDVIKCKKTISSSLPSLDSRPPLTGPELEMQTKQTIRSVVHNSATLKDPSGKYV